MSRTALACAIFASAVGVAAAADAPAPRWQCSPTGASALDPALAAAASDYLGRVEAIYPYQALGLVRAGDRFYLLNSRDVEWGVRTRLYLLALRLQAASGVRILRSTVDHNVAPAERHERAEPNLTPERQALGGTPGSSPPPGNFICLAAARAEREGVTRTPLGEIVLAAGQSVHLVDPHEPEVAVEVGAAQNRSLNLGEIILRSSRTGIYAGLTGQWRELPRPAGSAAATQPPDGTLIIRMASAGGSVAETRVEVPEWAAVAGTERQAASSAIAPERVASVTRLRSEQESAAREPALLPKPVSDERPLAVAAEPPPAVVPFGIVPITPSADPVRPDEGFRVVAAETTTVAPARPAHVPPSPAAKVAAATAVIAVSSSPATAGRASAGSAKPAASAAGQTYDEYAKMMKTLLAVRRSGAVRSLSEMTYVHPAVEFIRAQPR